ncbi:GntR family transcriptional regulator [Cnuibacter physcomitrellae]|uniref:GntR family transcriptional regulator n=1 Tax=Cnuibacter physcomitrellae TaxID=1619308 RepID=UPI00217597B0|nr:GntR family transcriptional regulator [Cnuibacter physcomitrellae]MCS5498396.1 GntR family transcriptional regulator [Cnuibacter physcomitrellae]
MRASERAYATLRREILDWELPPGTVLGEIEQSERLGVSRTPLRSALAALTAEGLVGAQSGRGLVVTPVSVDDARELFEVRDALEQKAARLAARSADRELFEGLAAEFADAARLIEDEDPARHAYYDLVARFDDALDASAANGFLVASLKGVRTHLTRIRRLAIDNPDRLRDAAAEHRLIAEAIAAGDEELAAAATRVHLHRSLANILAAAETVTDHARQHGYDRPLQEREQK